MCGLSGIAGDISTKDEAAFKELLLFNSVRGEDSTGAASVDKFNDDDITVFKQVGHSVDFLRSRNFDKLMAGSHRCLLGHNRSATRGVVKWRNAHPFMFDNTVGMHNGTLWGSSWHDLPDGSEFDTDSEAIIHSIDVQGPEKTIPQLDGSYTLAWYDVKGNSINLIRNEERPLVYCFSKDKKVLYFASELDLMVAALRRDGSRGIQWEKLMMLPVDTLYSWKIPERGQGIFEEPTRTKLEGKKKTFTNAGGGTGTTSYSSAYHQQYGNKSHLKNSSGGQPGSGNPDFFRNLDTSQKCGIGPTGTDSQKTGSSSNGGEIIAFPHGNVPLKRKHKPTYEKDGEFKGWITYVELPNFRVHRDPVQQSWISSTWDDASKTWTRRFAKYAPRNLPFTVLHFSDHKFKHVGKKKNKVVYFKGFGGKYLDESGFDTCCSFGCNQCQRQPEWGNDVTFINDKQEFLCEFCALDQDLVKAWIGTYETAKSN